MSYIDDIMGFNPSDLSAFNEVVNQNNYEQNVYKTNPVKLSKAEDGHYRAKIKIIYNPFDIKKSIVKQTTYFLQDSEGSILVRSKLGNDDRECPIFKSWKKLWYAGSEEKKDWARKMYDRNESQWVLVQVLEDINQPELVGKILVWKLPKSVFAKMSAKMNPSAESKKTPVPVMDYLIGLPLELDITPGPDDPNAPERKQREISYDLCEFESDYATIMKVDGTPLFDDAEMEKIDAYVTAKAEVLKAKTAAKKEAAQKTIEEITPEIKTLYGKAMDYLKENAVDLVKECAYQEWDEATTTRVQNWINAVVQMLDPKVEVVSNSTSQTTFTAEIPVINDPNDSNDAFTELVMGGNDDNLPF